MKSITIVKCFIASATALAGYEWRRDLEIFPDLLGKRVMRSVTRREHSLDGTG